MTLAFSAYLLCNIYQDHRIGVMKTEKLIKIKQIFNVVMKFRFKISRLILISLDFLVTITHNSTGSDAKMGEDD